MSRSHRNYRLGSLWNDLVEARCYLAFRKLQRDGFVRGQQADNCKELSEITGQSTGSLSAKICNYKSVLGINNQSNASENTKHVAETYASWTIAQLEQLVSEMTKSGNTTLKGS